MIASSLAGFIRFLQGAGAAYISTFIVNVLVIF